MTVSASAPISTIELAQDPKLALESAARVLRQSGVVALPTDTVYGLAALASDPGATDKLFALKQRPESVPIAILVADTAQALQLVAPPSRSARLLMKEFWPGPLTIVLPAAAPAPSDLPIPPATVPIPPATVGVRCPDHDFISELATQVGPLATTSANLHGQPVCATAAEVAETFALVAPTDPTAPADSTGPADLDANLNLIIDGGPLTAPASTVVTCLPDEADPELRLLREGAITQAQLEAVLNAHHRMGQPRVG